MKLLNTRKKAAIVSGISLLLMMVAAMIAYGVIYSNYYVVNDPTMTVSKLLVNSSLFNIGLALWCFIVVLDVIVSISFYVYLKPYNKMISTFVLISRLVYTVILGIAVSRLVSLSGYIGVDHIDPENVMSFFSSFEAIWQGGLILFGIHLFLVGSIAMMTNPIPKLWGILLLLAGVSYFVINILKVYSSNMSFVTNLEMILMLPMTIGEVGFGIWLLVKGRKVVD